MMILHLLAMLDEAVAARDWRLALAICRFVNGVK